MAGNLFHLAVVVLMVASLPLSKSDGVTNGFISFAVSELSVDEDSSNSGFVTVTIPFVREIGNSGNVLVSYRVTNSSASSEFLSLSNSATFADSQTEADGFLVIVNDAIPELNETYVVDIVDTRFGADVGPVNRLFLTIRASDEPFGRLRFAASSLLRTAIEPLSGQNTTVEYEVIRGPGIFGQVSVDYEVTGGPNSASLDVSPSSGQLSFSDQDNSTFFSFSILSDDLPENNETFTVRLVNPTGGALISESSDNQAQLIITANDSPVRFASSSVEVSEGNGTVQLTVYRGVVDGSLVGSLNQVTTVQYATASGTAIAGEDFVSSAGTVTFQSGVTSQIISIPITDDTSPEGDETFTVTLTSVSSDAVLQSPTSVTVVIGINDNAGGLVRFKSTATQIISEDTGTNATFTVERILSSLGDITITYSIRNSSNQLATSDFNPASGTVMLLDGETQTDLVLIATNDELAEELETFTVSIDGVLGGAGQLANESLRVAMLYVADSDDVYGVIETAANTGSVAVNSGNRELSFQLTRSGGTVGSVLVEFVILYLAPGITDPSQGVSGTVASATGSALIVAGQTSVDVTVTLFSSGFLEENGVLYVRINDTELSGVATPLVTPSSPRIGSTSSLTATVPFSAASGYISFSSNSLSVSVSEPDTGFNTVSLSLQRDGAFGTATVTWTATTRSGSTFSSDDIGINAAQVTIPNGGTSASITLTVLADDVPELDEPFNVQLLSVAQAGQNIASINNTAVVTILSNDGPEGTFFIASVSQGPFYIEENEQSSLSITVQRNGGDLTSEQIIYRTIPADTGDFIGPSGLLTFGVGVRLSSLSIAPFLDGIPEINETFSLELSSSKDIIGSPSSVSITILANDDWNGVFNFSSDSLIQTIDEPANPGTVDNSLITAANFTILRNVATFGEASVYWEVTSFTSDVTPLNGSVPFAEGATSGTFQVSARPDLITEQDLSHSIRLVAVSGGGRVVDVDLATLVVRQNDNPISIAAADLYLLGNEGQTLTVNVTRGGLANGVAVVSYSVIYQTASSADVVITPVTGTVTLQDGVSSGTITLTLVDDDEPELEEELEIVLTSVTGDAVLTSANTRAVILIAPSDDPNGVFQFAAGSLVVMTTEGSNVDLIVNRLEGSHGNTTVYWRALFVNSVSGVTTPAVPLTDLEVTADMVMFQDGQTTATITVSILSDGVPELEELYLIELVNTTGAVPGAVVSSSNDSATIVIEENDSPYGVFGWSQLDETWLAEDVPTDDPNNGTGYFNVSRTAGAFGTIQAIWEIRSASSPSLPSFTDLILKGSLGSDVATATPRPSTGTRALSFVGGSPSSLVTVPGYLQPGSINDGSFSISLWVLMNSTVNGMALAKGSSDSSTIFYGLALIADNDLYIMRFSYLPSTMNSGFLTVEVSVPQSSLPSDQWHLIVLSVAGNSASFYTDGSLVATRTLVSFTLTDGSGILTVGGLAMSQYFIGSLQDVRIYETTLSQQQITELYSNAVADSFLYISGVVTLTDGVAETAVSVQTRDDTLPEPTENFTVYLVAVSGKAELGTDLFFDIKVLKSDSSNGVFSLSPSSLLPVTTGEGSVVNVTVTRAFGMFGVVTVTWEVLNAADGLLASDDFQEASGNVTFNEGDVEKSFTVQSINETVPELDETFFVTLATLSVDDIYPSTTPTSGASLDTGNSSTNVTVLANDFPYGILELASSIPAASGTIPPATSIPQVNVSESSGTVTVYVVRAQGTVGAAQVDYATEDGTAVSGGVSPDYLPTGGSLFFGDGERVKIFSVALLDDSTPELAKYFFVNLSNPSGDGTPILGIGRDLVINIDPSDDAFGVFGFSSSSLSQVITEQSGGALIPFVVERGNKGRFDEVTVYWEVENGVNDVSPSAGSIVFAAESSTVIFYITVTNDLNPELHENFTVRLVNATKGRISDTGNSVALLTIRASDYPYGVFSFSPVYSPLTISETAGTINVIILRGFGAHGTVAVYYTSIDSGNGTNLATAGDDYVGVAGSVIFSPNQTSGSFQLTIIDDSLPEIPENIYLVLVNATLLSEPDIYPGTDVLPTVSQENATVIINENDNARGIFQFSSTTFTAHEGSNNAITLSRTAGSYGEVTVTWIVTLNSASADDINTLQGSTTIIDGVTTAPLGITIVDDSDPEFAETFTVALTSISGGASLGSVTLATVTIPTSDDPNGAFIFTEDSRLISVAEPDSGMTSVTLNVTRVGGALGLAFVDYNVTSATGDPVSADISFDSVSNLYFANGVRDRSLTVRILSDNVPELTEVFYVTLFGVTGGGRVGDEGVAQIRVLANDKPYGSTVSMIEDVLLVTEDTSVTVPLERSGGTFGDLRVTYSVRAAIPQALDRFLSPVTAVSPPDSSKLIEYMSDDFITTNQVNECAVKCVEVYTLCQSFVFDSSLSLCQLYTATIAGAAGNISRPNTALYYEAMPGQLELLSRHIATAGQDFDFVLNDNVTILEGYNSTYISVHVRPDTIPELRENFTVQLTGVAIAGESDTSLLPIIEDSLTDISIAENDSPYGIFELYIGQQQQTQEVQEPAGSGTLPVVMTVMRRGGTNGAVTVSWNLMGITASLNSDFSGNQTELEFADGERTKTITVYVHGDSMPEADESFQVFLSNPTGGAILADSTNTTVTIVIPNNDNAAGIISLAAGSRAAIIDEGNTVRITVERTVSQLGRVMVNWTITGSVNSTNNNNNNNFGFNTNATNQSVFANETQTGGGVESQFQTTSGYLIFEEGVMEMDITTFVIDDNLPEVQEPYYLRLVTVETLSPNIGQALLDATGNVAVITIRASDDPHGVVEFAPFVMSIQQTEESMPVLLSIVRNFGSIGEISVNYRAQSIAASLNPGETLATAGQDFNSSNQSVILGNGESSTVFRAPIINDDVPELAEVFTVQLLSAVLISDPTVSISLGSFTSVQITILENDNPSGIFQFQTTSLNVTEDIGMVEVTVVRNGGAFGQSVITFQTIIGDSQDFALDTQTLMFTDGMTNGTLRVTIVDDTLPELDELIQIQILSVSQGEVGSNDTVSITILANDDPNGRFQFKDDSLAVDVDEAGDTPTNENIAVLTVVRNGGFFGTVTVPYMVEAAGTDDLSPVSGFLTFSVGLTEQSIMLTAVSDTIPELDETYSVSLLTPIDGGRLDDSDTVAMVTILANQDPYGTFELYAPNSMSAISVEENVGSVLLELRRTSPSFGDINVTIATIGDSAFYSANDSSGDYTPISSPVLVEANTTVVQLSLPITDDDIPELDEVLMVQLVNVSGEANIGAQDLVTVTILTNDNAYGLIGFSESSLSTIISEPEFSQGQVTLEVQRLQGLNGNVTATWVLMGAHSTGEITPSSGTVSFGDGQQTDTIVLTISSDMIAELNETTRVVLTAITANGVPEGLDQSRGAVIDTGRSVAVITVTANDDPFGSVTWSNFFATTTESDTGNNTLTLTILRELGSHGALSISYMTANDSISLPDDRAIPGVDYQAVTSGVVIMADGQTSVTVDIIIFPDDTPELSETFLVVLTGVQLVNRSLAVGAPPDSPRLGGTLSFSVTIAENDYPQGALNIDVGPFFVSEDVGTFCVPVNRIGGDLLAVGARFRFQDGTATGGGVDFDSNEGIVRLGSRERSACINLNITDDQDPESDENFTVTIFGPIGGVQLGTNLTATVIILSNDDINGVFSFATDSLVIIANEGNTGTLTVQRSRGTVGTATIYWSVEEDGRNDLDPTSGNVTFTDGQSQRTFELEALPDGVPELFEAYSVTLTTIVGVGRLSHPLTASVAIPASDDPSGIIAFAQYPLDTIIIAEGASATITIHRYGGLFGLLSVQWQITPDDSSAFSVRSGSVFMAEGQREANLTISTIDDTSPEVAKLYTISLVAAGDGRINTSASQLQLIIPASDNVHGSIGFSPSSSSINENSGTVDVTILRSGGLEGDLLVNFTAADDSAVTPGDYLVNSTYLIISDGSNIGTITVDIIDDTIPEINELFTITITSVTLMNYPNGGRDFSFTGDDSLIDSLPTIDESTSRFDATITANDDAYGIISLTTSSYQVNEGTTLTVNVIRSAGTFGTLSLSFTVASGSALGNGIDYSAPSSPITIAPGQSVLQLSIPIVDDITPELQESFTITITGVEGGATLGSILSAIVIILPSDNPNGRVRFTADDVSGRVVANPTDTATNVMFEVLRLDGSIGVIDVTWEVTGPNPGFEREDILQSTLQGVLTFADQQMNNFITLTVLTNDGSEPEENFTISLTAATKGVAIDEDGDTALLIVSQKGMPFGVIGFYGEALSTITTSESVNLTLPLVRNQGTFGVSEVLFTVSGPSPLLDVSPASGSVTFQEGDMYSAVVLTIVADNIPELDETYTVTLTGVNGKAILDSSAVTSSFTIIANDSPYGTFGIMGLSLQLVYSGGNIVRRLSFAISRQFGTQGSVSVVVGINYTDEPNAGYFPQNITRDFVDGQSLISISIDSTTNAFLAAGAILNVSVLNVTLTSGTGGSNVLPEISSLVGVVLHTVSEDVANPSIGFSDSSVNAAAIDGIDSSNVPIVFERRGLEGNIQVTWSTGLLLEGVTNGSLLPATGTFFMGAGTTQITVNFTATPTDPPTSPEIFAIRLAVETLSPLVARVRDGYGLAIVEPWGVVKLTYESYSAVEGSTVNISVSRLYGSIGTIRVSGEAKAAASIPENTLAADPIIDYPLATLTVTLSDKVTSGDILIVLPFNSGVNPLKIFAFSLTSLERLNEDGSFSTPRLATPIQDAIVTIIDAQGGAGEFAFTTPSTLIHEDGSPLVQAIINRTKGSAGTVTVQLTIVEARADGSKPANQIASAAAGDFNPQSLVSMVTFANGETQKSVTVQVLNDNVPELREYFTIHLENPQGGQALIDPAKSTFEVGIIANDDQGGVFTLVTTSLVLDEDTQSEGVLTVRRTGGLFESVTINWQTFYTDGGTHPVALGELLVRDAANVTFVSGQSQANITLRLVPNKVPASGETFALRISSDNAGISFAVTTAMITANPSRFAVYQFSSNSRSIVATTLVQSLTIQRVQGLKLSSQVSYSTVESTDPITVGELTFEPAMASVHFTSVTEANVPFAVDVGNVTVQITIITTDTVPRAFYVTLQASGTSVVQNERAVVVINAAGTQSDLYRGYLTAYQATSSTGLNSVATVIKNKLIDGTVSGNNTALSATMKLTVDEIISTVIESGSSYPSALQVTMADIFDLIIRSGSFDGQFRYALSLKSFAQSLVSNRTCDEQSVFVSKVSYKITSTRYRPVTLRGMTFQSGLNDYIRLANSSLQINSECVDAQFIEYTNPSLYSLPLLGTKVMVLSLQNPSVPTLTTPITYRVRSPIGAIYPSNDDCLIWNYPTDDTGNGFWDTSTCTLAQSSILERDDVECQCQLVGDYAVAIPPRYGWTVPGPISCGFVAVVMIVAIVLHVIYFRRIQLGTRILIFVLSSIALFQVILLVDMALAPSISSSGCTALGVLLQLSVIAQFIWMFVLIVSLWMNLMGLTDGNEPLIAYIFVSWGLAIAIVVATILISLFGVTSNWNDIYGRVGELCFMPSAAIAGVSTAIPMILLLLIGVGVLSHSCFYWSRWEDIKSLYKDTFNKREIPLLLTFMALIVVTVLFGALHLYLQEIYLFFMFFAFNVIEGIYALVVYVFISWHTLTWKHKHYPIKEDVEPLTVPEEPEFLGENYPSIYGSQQSLIPRSSTDHRLDSQVHLEYPAATMSSRSSVKPHHLKRTKSPATQLTEEREEKREEEREERAGDSDSGESGSYAFAPDSEGGETGSHMDDLMFALKTGISYSQDEDSQPPMHEMESRKKPSASEQYRLRRISIADTHL